MREPLLLFSEACLDHETGRHPECKERLVAIRDALRREGLSRYLKSPSRVASQEDILEVHKASLWERVQRATEDGGGSLDPDTLVSKGSWQAALVAAGMVIEGIETVLKGSRNIVFCFPRPPGHHATRDKAMGFCLFNNIAVGAAWAKKEGLKRILVLDWDVHHGNGTEDIFRMESDITFFSLHQYPFYPGSGWVTECGRGEGEGTIFNAPLLAGAKEDDYKLVMESVFVPLLEKLQPELILVSAGYDAHVQDPLAGIQLSSKSYETIAAYLTPSLEKGCRGILLTLEGGYHLEALSLSVLYTLRGLTEISLSLQDPFSVLSSFPTRETREIVKTLKERI